MFYIRLKPVNSVLYNYEFKGAKNLIIFELYTSMGSNL